MDHRISTVDLMILIPAITSLANLLHFAIALILAVFTYGKKLITIILETYAQPLDTFFIRMRQCRFCERFEVFVCKNAEFYFSNKNIAITCVLSFLFDQTNMLLMPTLLAFYRVAIYESTFPECRMVGLFKIKLLLVV